MIESGTESIPAGVVGYAIASTCLEVQLKFPGQSTLGVGPEVLELNVADPNQRAESMLFESFASGWPWVIADVNTDSAVSPSWSYSSPNVAYVSHMTRVELPEYDLCLHAAVQPKLQSESNFSMLLTPFSQEGLVFGLIRQSQISRNSDIRRLGMALATEWIDAWSKKETTRGVRVYQTAAFDAVYGKQAQSGFANNSESDEARRHAWFSDADRDLRNLANLSDNWNGYGAEAPNLTARRSARMVLDNLERINLQPSRIISSAAGGVSLCFFRPMKYAEVECYNSGESVAIIKNTQTNWRDIWEVDSVTDSIGKIQAFLQD